MSRSAALAGHPCLFGVNLPWFFGAYGHDLAPSEHHPDWGSDFDALRLFRPLIEAHRMGFAAVRVWLCENGEGIVTRDGLIDAVHPALLDGVRAIQQSTRLLGLRVYWTLLDGNSWQREGDVLTHAIVSDPEQSARFVERVAVPLAEQLDPEVTVAVEMINEPEAMTPECYGGRGLTIPWARIGAFLRTSGGAVRAARPGIAITAGTGYEFLPRLWRANPRLDAIDVHAYHRTAGLPSRADLLAYVGDERLGDPPLPLICGECGIPDGAPVIEHLQLQNYLFNAETGGYDAAFLWRLEKVLVDTEDPSRPLTDAGKRVARQLKNRLVRPYD
jgi:hypothetical protein